MAPWRVASTILAVALVLLYAGGANYWNRSDGWYESLQQPSWQPPGAVFGIIWPYNFVVIGIALYLIAIRASYLYVTLALILFAASLFFALRWSYLFYSAHELNAAATSLLVAALLTLPLTAITFLTSWRAGIAFLPYQTWILIAATLARGYASLN